jgi:N-acetylglucosamine-6-sulfatase
MLNQIWLVGPAARKVALLVAAVLVAVPLLSAACGGDEEGQPSASGQRAAASSPAASSPDRPNIVLVLADDLDLSVFEDSTLDSAWVPKGASFGNALATTSLCCPSRASILRGQYAHNTGLWNNDNSEWHGGVEYFRESGLEEETLATILQGNGYETWYGGKYLNGYGEPGEQEDRVPPGWDHWAAYTSGGINVDGRMVPYQGHYTDWLSDRAGAFLKERDDDRPFFMHVATLDTHEPLIAPPRHAEAYPYARAPRPPSFGEEDVSDKPRWVREGRLAGRPVSASAAARYDYLHAARMRSALTLEDLSRNLTDALSRAGELDETYIVFTSDNGFHQGLHGIRASKSTPYTEAHEVPFVMRGPGVPESASFPELVANTDIAPTALDLAGVEAPGWMDGRSLVPFFDGSAPEAWRESLLIEGARSGSVKRPAYSGVRRKDEVYVRYESGEEEYYDFAEDPYQLGSRPDEVPSSIKEDLSALEDCSGEGCREAEGP